MNTSEAKDKIIPAWIEALHEVGAVTQDSSGHHGKYATLGACLDAVKPVLKERGLAVQQYNTESERGVRVVTRIWHESGQWLEDGGLTMPAPSDPQKVGGAVTYARRYALTTFFAITTRDDDGQEATDSMSEMRAAKPSTPAQRRPEPSQEPEVPASAGRQVYDALVQYKGTTVAAMLKDWAHEQDMKLTLAALEGDDDWCAAVAERLADTIEAQAAKA